MQTSFDSYLSEGGRMGARIRAFDWDASPIGVPSTWPTSLITLIGVMLGSRQPMFVVWGDERTLLHNDAYMPLLGDRQDNALGRDILDVWREVEDDIGPIIEMAYAGEGVHMDDIALVLTRNGYPEEAHYAFSYTPVREANGVVAGFFCACQETTLDVIAKRELTARSLQLSAMFQNAPSFISVKRGKDHVIELANPAYIQLVGRSDIVGKTIREAFPDVAGQGYFTMFDEVYETGRTRTVPEAEVVFRPDPDGPVITRFVSFVLQPILDDDGQVTGTFVDGMDITDRVRSERALRESESRFRNMADHTPTVVWTTDETGYCTYLNRRWYEMTGQTPAEAEGFGWLNATHPDDREHAQNTFLTANAEQIRFEIEYRLRQADGTYRWAFDSAAPRFDEEGRFLGYVGSVLDIEERKTAEERQELLTRELHHRVKNSLATVQAIITLTARTASDIAAFQAAISARISALARSHTLVNDDDWQGMRLVQLLSSELSPYDEGNRITFEGDDLDLSANFSLPLAMAVHELTTNAVKYGALSVPGGRLTVSWNVEPTRDAPHLHLRWQETGGPRAVCPTSRGFGTTLIERLLGDQLHGTVEVSYLQTGIDVHISAPMP